MKLKSEHPLAQSKWHGVGLNLRKKLSPSRINELSSSLIERHKEINKRLDRSIIHHQQAEKDAWHPNNYFTDSKSRRATIDSLSKRADRLHHLNRGLHHKPIKGDDDEWMAGKK